MLASPVQVLPRGRDWSFEFKWDGVRALIDGTGGGAGTGARISSRRGNDVTVAYPELAGTCPDGALLDGEIVAFVDGRPSFEALQTRMHVRSRVDARRLAERIPVTFMAFDLLRLDGTDLTGAPLRERRAGLGTIDGLTLSPSFDDGPATEDVARRSGLEGVVAKRSGSRYRPGLRTSDWQKLRFVRAGDFAVIGWEAPAESPDALSSLLLAIRTSGGMVFAGKVGSGLTGRIASSLHRRLSTRADCVLAELPPSSPGRVTTWVEPEVVVEVAFTLMTSEGRLRHPVFRRVRTDKTVDEAEG